MSTKDFAEPSSRNSSDQAPARTRQNAAPQDGIQITQETRGSIEHAPQRAYRHVRSPIVLFYDTGEDMVCSTVFS
jgi:hypothetical protein